MEIKKNNFTQDEIELLKIIDDGDKLYDKLYFRILNEQILIDENNKGFFKIFTYKNSLRFNVFMNDSLGETAADWLANEIDRYINNTDKKEILLWYYQINGFSKTLLNKLGDYINPYHFYFYRIDNKNINPVVDMKVLTKRRCTEDMIDACIEIMEEVFTPFPDSPGSFLQDKERIKNEYLNDYGQGGVELFFKNHELIGFCGHINGHITEVCVRKEFQGMGYGEIIVRSTLKSIYESGFDANLTAGNYNARAIHLYEKVGFERIYEAIRVNLIKQ